MAMLNGGYGPQVMRSLRRDSSVTKERLSPGIVRRIARYARPYRWQIAAFLALVVLDAVVVIANPLLLKAIIDQGIVARAEPAWWSGWPWRRRARAWWTPRSGLAQRWYSARIGEGLIYDLRTEVFDHVQRSRWRSSRGRRPARWSAG